MTKYIISFRETLLSSCWDDIPTKRPHASELVELLSKHTRLISPCLHEPSSAVQYENRTSEMTFSDNATRRQSVSKNKKVGLVNTSENSDPLSITDDNLSLNNSVTVFCDGSSHLQVSKKQPQDKPRRHSTIALRKLSGSENSGFHQDLII